MILGVNVFFFLNDKFFKIGEDKIVKNIRVFLYFKKGDVIIKGYV